MRTLAAPKGEPRALTAASSLSLLPHRLHRCVTALQEIFAGAGYVPLPAGAAKRARCEAARESALEELAAKAPPRLVRADAGGRKGRPPFQLENPEGLKVLYVDLGLSFREIVDVMTQRGWHSGNVTVKASTVQKFCNMLRLRRGMAANPERMVSAVVCPPVACALTCCN